MSPPTRIVAVVSVIVGGVQGFIQPQNKHGSTPQPNLPRQTNFRPMFSPTGRSATTTLHRHPYPTSRGCQRWKRYPMVAFVTMHSIETLGNSGDQRSIARTVIYLFYGLSFSPRRCLGALFEVSLSFHGFAPLSNFPFCPLSCRNQTCSGPLPHAPTDPRLYADDFFPVPVPVISF